MKKYSLALGGGAAKGLAHIGVIKYIEENNIEIQEVSGTSMGSIIAALYALGKNSEDMIEIAKNINYLKLIDINMKDSLLKGNKVLKKLETLLGDTSIEDTNIPLKIVATNVKNGEKKVFTSGKIIDAVRASISLPGIFQPYKIDGEEYMDGGVVNNLPIEDLEGDNIIAVSTLGGVDHELKRKRKILGFDFPVGFFNLNFQILQRAVIFMMKQNEGRSLTTKGKKIILIEPNYGKLDIHHFHKVNEFIKAGYQKASEVLN